VPNNACLVVAGDFDPEVVKADIARYFGPVPSRAMPSRPAPDPWSGIVQASTTIQDRVDADQLNLFFHTPAWFAPGQAEVNLLATLLADGESSRLYKKLVATGLAQEVDAYDNALQYGGIFKISVTAMPDASTTEIESIVRAELDSLAAAPPTPEEMEWLHNQAAYASLTNLEPLQNRALRCSSRSTGPTRATPATSRRTSRGSRTRRPKGSATPCARTSAPTSKRASS
jgi:zinc protease